jgi:glycyl-tRNA synthetase (class II)
MRLGTLRSSSRSEFTMAEIEHFVDPLDKAHERFESVKDIKLRLLPKDVQAEGRTDISEMTIGEAVKTVSVASFAPEAVC